MPNTVQLTHDGQPVFPVTDRSLVMDINPHGETSSRPTPSATEIGLTYFDTTLGKPIWWNGTAWVDSTGASV